jgi:hypothetical protein
MTQQENLSPSLEDHVLNFLHEFFPNHGPEKTSHRIGFFTPIGWGAGVVCVTIPSDLAIEMDKFRASLIHLDLEVSNDYHNGLYLVYITQGK